jgi:steroid delta-isomerase-like uncharacterized protein
MRKLCMILPLALILCFMVGCQDKEAMAELDAMKAQAAIEEQNALLIRQFMEKMDENAGLNDELLGLLADDFEWHMGGIPEPLNKEASEQFVAMLYSGFPDFSHTLEDMIAKGDKVAARCVARGTHEREFQGIPPTGNNIEYGSLELWKIEDGKISRLWIQSDMLGLMQQLGMELKPKEE